MDREQTIKDILEEKLVGNDIHLVGEILSYLKSNCFVCWKLKMGFDLHKAYCDVKTFPQLYMEVCDECLSYFDFKNCCKCKIWVDKTRCYVIGGLDQFYSCEYCANC